MASKKKWLTFVESVWSVVEQADSHPQAYVAYHGVSCGYTMEVDYEDWTDQFVDFTCCWDGQQFIDDRFSPRSTPKELDEALKNLKAVIPLTYLPSKAYVRASVEAALVESRGKHLGSADTHERELAENIAKRIGRVGE